MYWGFYRGHFGIMEKKMEATIVYWDSSKPDPPKGILRLDPLEPYGKNL